MNPTRTHSQPAILTRGSRLGRHISMNSKNPAWLLEQILEIRLRILGKEHPATLNSIRQAAQKAKDDGDLEKAREYLEDVVSFNVENLGRDDPETLGAKFEYAQILKELVDLGEAEDILRGILETKEEELQLRLDMMSRLNKNAQTDLLQQQEAVAMVQTEILQAKHDLATTLQASGDRVDLREAEDLHWETLEKRVAILGPEHPDVVESKTALAQALEDMGDREGAAKIEKEAAAARMRLSYMWTGKDDSDWKEIREKIKDYNEGRGDEDEEMDMTVPSHLQLDFEEDGKVTQLRHVYVDEYECIGCTFCAEVAPNTFYLEENAGRARAFHQGGDEPEILSEAIDCCPVNCISFVDLEDLIILETEREAAGPIDPVMIGLRGVGDAFDEKRRTETQAKMGKRSMMTCSNCPSRGCKDCPMYGVGKNPAYEEKLQRRLARKEAKMKEKEDETQANRKAKLDAFFSLLNKEVDNKNVEAKAESKGAADAEATEAAEEDKAAAKAAEKAKAAAEAKAAEKAKAKAAKETEADEEAEEVEETKKAFGDAKAFWAKVAADTKSKRG